MEEKVSGEMDSLPAKARESEKKTHVAFEILLLMSAAVVVGALAVGMYIIVFS